MPISATALRVNTVLVSFDPADTTATVYIKDAAGKVIIALISTSQTPFRLGGTPQGYVDLSKLFVDSGTNSKGPYVGYEVG